MSIKTAIVIKNCKDPESKKYLYNFCPNILVNTIFDNIEIEDTMMVRKFCEDNKLSAVLFLNDDEELLHLDKSFTSKYICLTDGEWILKTNRVFSHNSKPNTNPTIVKTSKIPNGPKIDEAYTEFLKIYQEKNYSKFVVEIEKYFFHYPNMIPKSVILHYYAAVVYFFKLRNIKKGMSHICQGLIAKPSMSELWCLWGDVLVESKKYSEAYHIYDTAISAGKQRNIYDELPVWLKKYEEYPQEMKSKIKNLIDKTQVFEIK